MARGPRLAARHLPVVAGHARLLPRKMVRRDATIAALRQRRKESIQSAALRLDDRAAACSDAAAAASSERAALSEAHSRLAPISKVAAASTLAAAAKAACAV